MYRVKNIVREIVSDRDEGSEIQADIQVGKQRDHERK